MVETSTACKGSDLWALGVMLFEMVVGRTCFEPTDENVVFFSEEAAECVENVPNPNVHLLNVSK